MCYARTQYKNMQLLAKEKPAKNKRFSLANFALLSRYQILFLTICRPYFAG